MGASEALSIFFVICAAVSFMGMMADKMATNRRNYTRVFIILVILTTILNFGK